MTEKLTCEFVDHHDLLARFVAGRLTEQEAQALEEHCLECDRCWSELRLALRIHAAAHAPEVTAAPARAIAVGKVVPRRWTLGLLAAAALVIAVGGLSLRYLTRPEPDLVRGAPSFRLKAAATSDGGVRLVWPEVQSASRYVVSMASSDGRLLLSREVTSTSATVSGTEIATQRGLRATVTAFDALGGQLAESDPTTLP